MLNLLLREIQSQLRSAVALVFLTVFLVGTALWFLYVARYFDAGVAWMRAFFIAAVPVFFTLIIPGITMRSWSEEWRSGSDQLLLTLPAGDWNLVLAKFLAGWVVVAVSLVLTFPVPLLLRATVAADYSIDWGPIATGYLGAFLYGGLAVAIGQCLSARTEHQFIAFVLALVTLLAFTLPYLILQSSLDLPGWAVSLVGLASIPAYLENSIRGIVDTRDLVFFATAIVFFLALTWETVRARRAA